MAPPVTTPIGRTRPVTGRFAPSPTGALHLGSLTTALASYCHIKSLGGQWQLRIEDTDFERCTAADSDQILYDLEALGLHWDGAVRYQSAHLSDYEDAIAQLSACIYPCRCSRKQLAQLGASPRYPRRCLPPAQAGAKRLQQHSDDKLRLQLPDVAMAFYDGILGIQWQNPQQLLGDVVIKRQNRVINYLLACAVDDGLANISHVMRGADILEMTAAQRFIQLALGLPLPDHYYHLPLLINHDGQKLSKQNLATPIDTRQPNALLVHALSLLGQSTPQGLETESTDSILAHAVAHWQNDTLIGRATLGVV